MTDSAFEIRRGFLSKTETLVPYRNIQNVYTDQSILYRIFGLATLIVLTAGSDSVSGHPITLQGMFDTIDVSVADILEQQLISRTAVQPVKIVP